MHKHTDPLKLIEYSANSDRHSIHRFKIALKSEEKLLRAEMNVNHTIVHRLTLLRPSFWNVPSLIRPIRGALPKPMSRRFNPPRHSARPIQPLSRPCLLAAGLGPTPPPSWEPFGNRPAALLCRLMPPVFHCHRRRLLQIHRSQIWSSGACPDFNLARCSGLGSREQYKIPRFRCPIIRR